MPITVSYDLAEASPADRNYIRSMFERFGWKRLGGSVLRYQLIDGQDEEDWLNDVVPALTGWDRVIDRAGRVTGSSSRIPRLRR
jgi:hypothetical protein